MSRNLLLVMVVILAACTGGNKQSVQKSVNIDSLNTVRQRVADSISNENQKRRELEDLSLSAYGGARFGMSMEEVLMTEGFSGGTSNAEIVKPPVEKRKVGNYNYDIVANFHENKLYLVTFGSVWQTAAFIEFDLTGLVKNLKDVITIRYGEPHYSYKMPNVMDFEPGSHRWVYKWEIEEKVIEIGMRESGEGANYQAVMWIFNKPVFDKIGYNKANVNKVRDAAKF